MITRLTHRVACCIPLLLVASLAGCAGRDLPDGPTGTVDGTATFQGRPIPVGSTITCVHLEKSLPAVGEVQQDGHFTLRMKNSSTILAGKYSVAVFPPTVQMTPQEAMTAAQAKKLPNTKYPEIPERYRSAETSGTTLEVKPGANKFELDLKEDNAPK